MDPLSHQFFTLAGNNAWANLRLLRACAQLSDAEFTAARTSFFPSLSATLNHNLTVDWYYVDALERWQRGQPPHDNADVFFASDEPFTTCAPLAQAQHAVDQRLLALTRALTDAQLARPLLLPRARGTLTESPTRLLLHLFQTRSITAARRTPCSPAPRSHHRSWTSSSAPMKPRCARPNSRHSA